MPAAKSSENMIEQHLSTIKNKMRKEIDQYIEEYFTLYLSNLVNTVKKYESRIRVNGICLNF